MSLPPPNSFPPLGPLGDPSPPQAYRPYPPPGYPAYPHPLPTYPYPPWPPYAPPGYYIPRPPPRVIPPHEPPPPPAQPPRGWQVGLPLAWVAILLIVGAKFHASIQPVKLSDAAVDPSARDVQFDFQSRLAVGIHAFESSAAKSTTAEMRDMQETLEESAATPADQIRLVAVTGEIASNHEALQRINDLRYALPSLDERRDLETLRRIYSHGARSVDADAAERLRQRLGWYGRLAMSHGLSNAEHTAALNEARHTFVIIIGIGLLAIVAALAGFALMITLCLLFGLRNFAPLYRPARWGTPFAETFAIYMLSFFGLSMLLTKVFHALALQWNLLIIPAALLPCLWPLLRGMPARSLRYGLGWIRGRGFLREVGAGLLGYIAGLPLLALGFAFAVLIVKKVGIHQSPVTTDLSGGPVFILMLYALVCVCAPLTEETLFRGALYNSLRNRFGWLISAAVTSLLFAMVHPYGWAGLPIIGTLGFTLACLREWRGSLVASMTAHSLHNFIVLTTALLLLR